MLERDKLHSFRFCPDCKAPVGSDQRFCGACFYWLARPVKVHIRNVEPEMEAPLPQKIWIRIRLFMASIHYGLIGFVLGILIALVIVFYIAALMPTWFARYSPDLQKHACYENMRSIQTAMETWLINHKFTPDLAGDPGKFLHEQKFLLMRPQCPIHGNLYRIPKGGRLQCIGSEGHGFP